MEWKVAKNGACRFSPSMPLRLKILEKWVNFGSRTRLLERDQSNKVFRHLLLVTAATLCLWAGEVAVSYIIHSSDARGGGKTQTAAFRTQLPETEGARK